jgi:Fe-S-cluster containining protein
MVSEDLRHFFDDNPKLYGHAGSDELGRLAGIHELYPDGVRLLSDKEAVELQGFECRRCGNCCSAVKYVTVCHEDVKRWVRQKRADILESLAIDRRRTPLLALKKRDIPAARAGARSLLDDAGLRDERVFELLYVTGLLECAVYVGRKAGVCTHLMLEGGYYSCAIQDTKPEVCERFPYYMGKYTDGRLLKEDSFCPSLRQIAIDKKKGKSL